MKAGGADGSISASLARLRAASSRERNELPRHSALAGAHAHLARATEERLRAARARSDGLHLTNQLREAGFWAVVMLVVGWLGVLSLALFFQGFGGIPWRPNDEGLTWVFHLTSTDLGIFLGGLTLSVVGLLSTVTRNLFPAANRDKDGAEE